MKPEEIVIEALIPHAGRMCLLDSVLHWDAAGVVCRTRSHLHTDNPLRRDGRLHAVHGLEYGAQSMAVHAALLAGTCNKGPGRGYLAAARSLELHCARLDRIPGEIEVRAQRLAGSDSGDMLYHIALYAGERVLVEGRATIAAVRETRS